MQPLHALLPAPRALCSRVLAFAVLAMTLPAPADAGLLEGAFGLAKHAMEQRGPGKASDEARRANLPPAAGGFSACLDKFPGGQPPVMGQIAAMKPRELCFDSFAILHSGHTKTPLFAVEKLTRDRLSDAQDGERTNVFYADARLPRAERAELSDYVGSGYDRGHMAPAADMPNDQSMAQSFSLANMVPQAEVNNRKTWAGIEKATRKFAKRAQGNVWVISGPVFARDMGKVGGVTIPSHLFKLVYDEATGRAWAHWLENTNEARAGAPIGYEELVRRTGGIQWLPGVRVTGSAEQ